MVSGIFTLVMYVPIGNTNSQQTSSPVLATAIPSSSISNTAYLNTTTSYYHNVNIVNSTTTTTNVPYAENTSQGSINSSFSPSLEDCSNGEINITDTSIRSMEEETKIRVKPETLMELRKHKALGEFVSYDDLLQYWMKVCPISAPPGEEVKK